MSNKNQKHVFIAHTRITFSDEDIERICGPDHPEDERDMVREAQQ